MLDAAVAALDCVLTNGDPASEGMTSCDRPPHHAPSLRLSVIDILLSPRLEDRTLPAALTRLWREDPHVVITLYDELSLAQLDHLAPGEPIGRHGLLAERMRELRRPTIRSRRRGLTIQEVAKRLGLALETTARLLEHHGYLELAPYGSGQRRRLLSNVALRSGIGHNVDPSTTRSRRLDGGARAAPFPVIYAEELPDVAWTLAWDVITADCARRPTKRKRLGYLLAEHGYLPDQEIATLAGCSRKTVSRARRHRRPAKCPTEVI